MTGWRVGYVMGNADVIGAITKLQENVAACAPLPSFIMLTFSSPCVKKLSGLPIA